MGDESQAPNGPPPLPPDRPPRGVEVPYARVAGPVEYAGWVGPPPRSRFGFAGQYFIGLGVGVLISLVVYGLGWSNKNGDAAVIGALVIVSLKFIVGTVFLCLRGLRGYGAGFMTSLAAGFLIFFVTCAMSFK